MTMNNVRQSALGSLRWHQEEWRRAMGDAASDACVSALARLSYENATLCRRLNQLTDLCNDLHAQTEHAHQIAHHALNAARQVAYQVQVSQQQRQPDVFRWPQASKGEKPN